MKFLIFCLFFPLTLFGDNIPRRIIAFWDSIVDQNVDDCLVHRTLEMPLNYLGLDVIYYDIQQPLPNLSMQKDVRGILLCFQESTKMPNPKAFIEWAVEGIDKGKKVVILRNPGFLSDSQGNYTSGDLQNRLFEKIGFINTQEWIEYPFDYQVLNADKELFPFEKNYPTPLPGFYITQVYDPSAKAYLKVGVPDKSDNYSEPIIISPSGAYVSELFANTYDNILYSSSPRSLGWHFDPFQFFRIAFDIASTPIPDTTTLAGRRIYTATCHGDNWNTETAISEYKDKEISCAEVILEKVVKAHPDLPIAVGIVAADIDPKWVAKKDSQDVARRYLELPQVEAASHTYSHPFYWDFFRTGGPEKEIDYLYLYPYGTWQNSYLSWFRATYYQYFKPQELAKKKIKWGYTIPRSYANEPFDLNKEIFGAVDYINLFAPPENKVKLLIWSGDSRPWDTPLEMCYQAKIKNYGGGFSRFDPDYPSYLFVYPLGRKPGNFIQLYTAANAENSYTHEWRDTFYGFQFLPITLQNTESPRRIKPINLYFHSYSGEFEASLNALLKNINFIKAQSIISLRVARYCEIGEGFYSVEIESLGDKKWRIRNRKGLQTIRFDNVKETELDLNGSSGLVGCKEYQNSLYVYLDAAVQEPIISLKNPSIRPQQASPLGYLVESSWEIWNLHREGQSISFYAQGWGKFVMQWRMPQGEYSITVNGENSSTTTSGKNIIAMKLDIPFNRKVLVTINRI